MISIGIGTTTCQHGFNSGTTCSTSTSFFGDTTTSGGTTTYGITLSGTDGQTIIH